MRFVTLADLTIDHATRRAVDIHATYMSASS